MQESKTGPRHPDEPELVGAMDAAEILGVRQVNLRTLRDLPLPYGKIRASTVWRADEMRAFAKQRAQERAELLAERADRIQVEAARAATLKRDRAAKTRAKARAAKKATA